jgi:hypothetical protein
MNKICTTIEQSKKLLELEIDINTADIWWNCRGAICAPLMYCEYPTCEKRTEKDIPAWSLTALLKYLSEIKSQEYTPILFPTEGKWILQFLEYGRGNVWEVSCDNPIDACVKMILKLHKFNLL